MDVNTFGLWKKQMKECKNCQKTKEFSFFSVSAYNDNGSPSRYRPKCKECTAEENTKRYHDKGGKAAQAHRARKHNLKKYGLTVEEYDKMLEEQQGMCKICGAVEGKQRSKSDYRLFVDHCHASGKVRGLLCHNCNTGLGHFFDSVHNLQKAIGYLNENCN